MSDAVNHPHHYTQGSVECIDAIAAALGPAFPAFLRGQVMKYMWRGPHKNGLEDYRVEDVLKGYSTDQNPVKVSQDPNDRTRINVEMGLSPILANRLRDAGFVLSGF